MERFLNLVISGAVSGAIYSIMASGLVLTYQTSGIFNFAHGAVAFVTAYFYFQLHSRRNGGLGWPVVPSAIDLGARCSPRCSGSLLDRMLLRRLATAPVYARIVGTIGLLVALPALALWLVETVGNRCFDLGLPGRRDRQPAARARALPGGRRGAPWIGSRGRSTRTRWRSSWRQWRRRDRAVARAACDACRARDACGRRTGSDLAGLRGVNASRTSAVAWILTMMLAGIGGMLIAPIWACSPTSSSRSSYWARWPRWRSPGCARSRSRSLGGSGSRRAAEPRLRLRHIVLPSFLNDSPGSGRRSRSS